MNPALPIGGGLEPPRPIEGRGARALVPVIEIESPRARESVEDGARRSVGALRGSSRGYDGRSQDAPRGFVERRGAPNLAFAAQWIAQEVLSEGLYHEDYRPAVAAYNAADSNFETVRRPPRASVEIWA